MKRLRFVISVIVIALLLSILGCDQQTSKPVEYKPKKTVLSDNLVFSYPDEVSSEDVTNKDNYIIKRNAYVLSYNDSKHIPNWVTWHLSSADMGGVGRTDFKEDSKLPEGFYRVKAEDYTETGMDRGHMCPSKARSRNTIFRDETYYMTNIVPQNHKNNAGAWVELEKKLQTEVKDNKKEAYIVCGPYGIGGETSDNNSGVTAGLKLDYIVAGDQRIVVPAVTWKVAILIPEGDDDLVRINDMEPEDIEVFAVWMPNNENVKASYVDHIVSVDYIEKMTGFDFFSELVDSLESVLEDRNSKLDPDYDIAV